MRRWDCSTKTTSGHDDEAQQDDAEEGVPAAFFCWMAHSEAGKPDAIDVKISSDMPLPMPRSVMSSPNHMMRPVPAVIVRTMMRIVGMVSSVRIDVHEGPKICCGLRAKVIERRRLQDREADGQVAGVLRQLGLPGLALLLEGLEPRDDHGEQLDDDARRDVRHDPQREDRQLEQRTAAEEVRQAEEPAPGGSAPDEAVAHLGVGHARASAPRCPAGRCAMMQSVNSSFLRRSGVLNARTKAESTDPPGRRRLLPRRPLVAAVAGGADAGAPVTRRPNPQRIPCGSPGMRAAGPHAGVPAVRIPARWSVSDRSDGRGRAAGRLDLLLGGAGELVDRHVDLDGDLAGAEHLDRAGRRGRRPWRRGRRRTPRRPRGRAPRGGRG